MSTFLDLLAVAAACGFAWLVWPPAVLIVLTVAFLLAAHPIRVRKP